MRKSVLKDEQKAMRLRMLGIKSPTSPSEIYRQTHMTKLSEFNRNLKKRYGMTSTDYEEMLDRQGGACLLCGGSPKDDQVLCVDHNHKTGRIRALLCVSCNMRVGLLESWPHVVKAIQYIVADRAVSDCHILATAAKWLDSTKTINHA